MRKTFGQFQKDKSTGLLRAVTFPSMAMLDTTTGDGREIASSGAGVRELPRTIFAQFAQMPGHGGSVPVGTLQEVTFEDDGNVSGRGWLADLAIVREQLVPMIASKILFHNSVDLAEVTVEYVWKSDDPADGADYWTLDKILFTKSNIAATTIVGVPAFADARIALDEITAALVESDSELEWDLDPDHFTYHIEAHDEIMASLGAIDAGVSWDDFHMPEPDVPTAHTVDEHGRIFGHLAKWGECHEGREDVCILAPRPMSYATFNKGKVLTDKGMAETGPIFFLGGHPDKPLDVTQIDKAYGGIENAWGDVRVVDGRIGPWYSGRVRPDMPANSIYAARASAVSGHWKRGELQAVVSVNQPGYLIPGTEIRADRGGASFEEGEIVDLVASLRLPPADPEKMREAVAAEVKRQLSLTTFDSDARSLILQPNLLGYTAGSLEQTAPATEAAEEVAPIATIDPNALRALEIDLVLAELDDEDES